METDAPVKKKNPAAFFIDIAEAVVTAIVAAIFIITLICRIGYVSGGSMLSTMSSGDRYIVSNLFYTPQAGDIIVFQPETEEDGETLYVKRIIALGGQTVDITLNEYNEYAVYVDGAELQEPYLDEHQITYPSGYPPADDFDELHVQVPEGYVFVMGDNRLESKDSRVIGCIDVRRIVGKVLLRFYPIDKFGTVD